jgi:hypothetical protein
MGPSPTSSWLDSLLSAPPELQAELVRSLTPEQLQELEEATLWRPQPARRLLAYDSPADILFYGGARPAAGRPTSRSASPAPRTALDHLPPRVPVA